MKYLIFLLPVFLTAQYNPIGSNTAVLLRPDKGISLNGVNIIGWTNQVDNVVLIPDNPADTSDSPAYTNNEPTFTTTNTEHLEAPSANLYMQIGTSDFTISIRFKKPTLAINQRLLSVGAGAQTTQFAIGAGPVNTDYIFAYNLSNLTQTANINNTDYFIITVVRSGNSGTIYLNGAFPVTNASYFTNLNLITTTRFFTIGARLDGASNHFDGIITDIKIDYEALALSEIEKYINWIAESRPSTDKGFKKFNRYNE